ncbi:MAG: GNAT family N-acetyltransferase [Actinomycetota bacterium]
MAADFETTTTAKAVGLLDMAARRPRRANGLRVSWHDTWDDDVAAAVAALPAPEPYGRETFEFLARQPADSTQRIVIVSERDEPIACLALSRADSLAWEPVTHSLVAGQPFPIRDRADFTRVCRAVDVELHVMLWDGGIEPDDIVADEIDIDPTFRATHEELEAHWSKKHRRTIKQARSRSGDFVVEINEPDAARWILDHLYDRWDLPRTTFDRRVASLVHLLERDAAQLIRLFDGDRPVGGHASIIMNDTLYLLEIYRDADYGWHGVGNRLIDVAIERGASLGLRYFDLSTGFGDYKRKWAPEAGSHAVATFRPRRHRVARACLAVLG